MTRKGSILLGAVALTFAVAGSGCGGQGTSGPPDSSEVGKPSGVTN